MGTDDMQGQKFEDCHPKLQAIIPVLRGKGYAALGLGALCVSAGMVVAVIDPGSASIAMTACLVYAAIVLLLAWFNLVHTPRGLVNVSQQIRHLGPSETVIVEVDFHRRYKTFKLLDSWNADNFRPWNISAVTVRYEGLVDTLHKVELLDMEGKIPKLYQKASMNSLGNPAELPAKIYTDPQRNVPIAIAIDGDTFFPMRLFPMV